MSQDRPRCRLPFDGGAGLCDACRARVPRDGLKHCSRMVAESEAMRACVRAAARLADSEAPVVILGETGTGKEVMARALHASSRRAERPFVAVNCGAIPAELLESELFGHARGAFTGAVSERPGLFEAADGGTLLLDEVSELPAVLQVKLLRVLQGGEVRRVGENRTRLVDVRVLAATHDELRAQVEAGRFRQDLYYRLKVLAVHLPPLRERRGDILPMARQFLALEGGALRGFTPEAERALLAWPWPGNCRELESSVRHGAALAEGEEVTLDDLPEELRGAAPPVRRAPARERLGSLAEAERAHVLAVLAACAGRQAEAAQVLGISRSTLWRKLEAWRREGAV
jgi:DNA-binding NtrC family response regulator